MKTVQQDDKHHICSNILASSDALFQLNSPAYPVHNALDLKNAQHGLMGQLMLILLNYENVTI